MNQLQLACDRQYASHQAEGGRMLHLIRFVELEVVGRFMTCAEETAALLPRSQERAATLVDQLGRIAGSFDRAVAVSALASEAALVPAEFRSVMREASDGLFDWSADFCTLIAAAAVAP